VIVEDFKDSIEKIEKKGSDFYKREQADIPLQLV